MRSGSASCADAGPPQGFLAGPALGCLTAENVEAVLRLYWVRAHVAQHQEQVRTCACKTARPCSQLPERAILHENTCTVFSITVLVLGLL